MQTTEVFHIYHLADIHIRTNFHDDISYAIDQVQKHAKESTERGYHVIVVIAGDIFHKHEPTALDLRCFHNMIGDLASIPKIVIITIPGNHDYNDCQNADNLDIVSAVLIRPYPNVNNYAASGVYPYKFGNTTIYFHIHSLIDGITPDNKDVLKKKGYHIAITHRSMKNYGEYNIGEVDNINDGKNYDLLLLGDIHDRRFLTRDGFVKETGGLFKAAYPGSLVQQSSGESFGHGYILWVLKDKTPITGKMITLNAMSAYITVRAKNNKIISGIIDRKKFMRLKSVNFIHEGCSTEFIGDAAIGIEKKYGMKPKITTKNINIGAHVSIGEKFALTCVENQVKLLEEKLSDYQLKDAIIEMHVDNLNNFIMPEIKRPWSLNYLKWDNLLCYLGDNFIDFRNINGIASIIGKNGIGKSAVLDILSFILYNQVIRGLHTSCININAKSGDVTCSFSIDNVEYVVRRIYNKNGKGGGVALFRYVDEMWEDISGKGVVETYKIINGLIGNFADFERNNIGLQNHVLYVDRKCKDLYNQFINCLGLDELNNIYDVVMSSKTEYMRKMKKFNEYKIEKGIKFNYDKEYLENIYANIEKCEDNISIDTEELNDLNAQRDKLLLKYRYEIKKAEKRSVVELEDKIREYNDALKKLNINIDKQLWKNKIKDNDELIQMKYLLINPDIPDFLPDVNETEKDIPKLEKTIKILQNQLTLINLNILNLKFSDKCSCCKNNKILLTIDKNTGEIEEINAKIKTLQDIVETIKAHVKKAYNDNILLDITTLKNETHDLQEAVKIDDNISGINVRLNIFTKNATTLRMQNNLDIQIQRSKMVIEKQKLELTKLIDEKKKVLEFIDKYEKYDEILSKYKILTVYANAISNKHGIQSMIANSYMKDLEDKINTILQKITDFTIKILYDEENGEINIKCGDLFAAQMSGAQKFIIDIAIRIVFILGHPYLPNFLIIDEGFGQLDKGHLDHFKLYLQGFKEIEQLKFIMVISHIDGIEETCDTKLLITTAESSKIRSSQLIFGDPDIVPMSELVVAKQRENNPGDKMLTDINTNISIDNTSELVYLPETPLTTDQISDTLSFIILPNGEFKCDVCGKILKTNPKPSHLNSLIHKTAINKK